MQNIDFETLPPFPDMSGWDDETYRAYIIHAVEEGLEDVRAGRVVDLDESIKRVLSDARGIIEESGARSGADMGVHRARL